MFLIDASAYEEVSPIWFASVWKVGFAPDGTLDNGGLARVLPEDIIVWFSVTYTSYEQQHGRPEAALSSFKSSLGRHIGGEAVLCHGWSHARLPL